MAFSLPSSSSSCFTQRRSPPVRRNPPTHSRKGRFHPLLEPQRSPTACPPLLLPFQTLPTVCPLTYTKFLPRPSNLSSLLPQVLRRRCPPLPLSPPLLITRGSPSPPREQQLHQLRQRCCRRPLTLPSATTPENLVLANDHFRRYGRDSVGHDDDFSSYGPNGNLVTTNFTSYGTKTAGADNFTSYANSANVPDLGFSNYAAESSGRDALFSQYSTTPTLATSRSLAMERMATALSLIRHLREQQQYDR
ncbi:hypothetical protein HPP92_006265 [Vanilla planifolia]|uniref:Uncharacterized protein n=1 Tax=Vanilla planifolia TaxID=51239 RepID=A0A835RVL2_VANPL|nr:hypothetical protein HPP92_006265 [Vanilla planifolia]